MHARRSLRGGALGRALGRKRRQSVFGDGQRIEVQDWGNLTENYKKGGHFDYVVGTLGFRKERERNLKKEIDEYLLFKTQGHQIGDPARAAELEKMLATENIRTAFTDRSMRLRDGLAGEACMKHHDESMCVDNWGHEAGCSCSACKPVGRNPAGAATAMMAQNTLTSYETEDPSAPLKKQLGKRFIPGAAGGDHVALAIHEHEATSLDRSGGHDDNFKKTFGRKIRASSESALRDTECAGRFTRHEELVRKKIQSPTSRGDVAMILQPKESDPALPNRVTTCLKAEGEFAKGYSEECDRIAVHWNPLLYRFDRLSGKDLQDGRHRHPGRRSFNEPAALRISRLRNILAPHEGSEQGYEGEAPEMCGGRGSCTVADRNASLGMAYVTNHALTAKEDQDRRNMRLQVDESFATQCQHVVNVRQQAVTGFQPKHRDSSNMAASLRWD